MTLCCGETIQYIGMHAAKGSAWPLGCKRSPSERLTVGPEAAAASKRRGGLGWLFVLKPRLLPPPGSSPEQGLSKPLRPETTTTKTTSERGQKTSAAMGILQKLHGGGPTFKGGTKGGIKGGTTNY